jgi:glycosyltransferase involved in cell wall biosynthesis
MIVIDDLFRGGTEQTLKSRLAHIPEGWNILVVVLYSKGSIGEELEKEGIEVVCLNMGLEGYIKSVLGFRMAVSVFLPDIVVFMRDVARGLLPVFVPGNTVKVLFWDNSIIYKSFRQFWSEFFQVKFAGGKLLCSSSVIADNLYKYYRKSDIKIISNCYDERLFRYDKSKVIQTGKKLKILTVGSMRYEKNHAEKINIAANLKKSEINFSLDIAGRGDFSVIQKLIDSKNLTNEVKITGEFSELHKVINSYDLFLMTSYSEGCPVALLEAVASGLPCVVYPFKGMDSFMDLRKFIFTVETGTPSEAAEIIVKIINMNPDTLIKQLNDGSEMVSFSYSSGKNSLQWFEYLASLTE